MRVKKSLTVTCAAKFKDKSQCLTPVKHPGDLCKKHGRDNRNLVVGRYSALKRQNIRERIRSLQQFERDAMDLGPEIEVLRALVIDTIENFDRFTEALMAWNETQGKGRPCEIPKIEEVSKLLESVGRMVTRQHEIRNRSSITMETFNRAVELMATAVMAYEKDPRVLRQIEDAWGNITLDAKHPLNKQQKAMNPHAIDAEIIEVTDE